MGWKCPECGSYDSTVPLGHSFIPNVRCWNCDNYFNPKDRDYKEDDYEGVVKGKVA